MSNQKEKVIMKKVKNYFRYLQSKKKKKRERERNNNEYLLQQLMKMMKHEND